MCEKPDMLLADKASQEAYADGLKRLAGADQSARIAELERECERLRERLEINDECPYDGIATRDAAMKFMTQEINSLRSKLENVSEEHDKAWRRAEASEQNLLALIAAFTAPPAAGVPEGFVDVMAAVFRELEHRHGDERGNAPRHSHTIPGVWDEDNGELAGKPCAWCALWNKGKEMLKAARTPTPTASEQQQPISDEEAVRILLSGGTLVFRVPHPVKGEGV